MPSSQLAHQSRSEQHNFLTTPILILMRAVPKNRIQEVSILPVNEDRAMSFSDLIQLQKKKQPEVFPEKFHCPIDFIPTSSVVHVHLIGLIKQRKKSLGQLS